MRSTRCLCIPWKDLLSWCWGKLQGSRGQLCLGLSSSNSVYQNGKSFLDLSYLAGVSSPFSATNCKIKMRTQKVSSRRLQTPQVAPKKFNRYFFTILQYALEKIGEGENKIKASLRSRSNSKNRKTSKTKTQTGEADKYSPWQKIPYAVLNNNVLSIQVWKEPWHIQWCSQLWKRTQESSTSGKSLNILEKPHIWDQRAQVTSAQLEGTFRSSSLQKIENKEKREMDLPSTSSSGAKGNLWVVECSTWRSFTDRQDISISLLSLQLRIQKSSWKHRHALHAYLVMSVTGRNQQLQSSSEYFLRSGAGLLPFMLNTLERAQWHRS